MSSIVSSSSRRMHSIDRDTSEKSTSFVHKKLKSRNDSNEERDKRMEEWKRRTEKNRLAKN